MEFILSLAEGFARNDITSKLETKRSLNYHHNMLTSIDIYNFALIEKLSVEFESGMSVITGETGAGKSIIIDSIDFALGGRSQSYHLRKGADRAEVNLCFDIEKATDLKKWLVEHELDDGQQCILRRTLSKDGRTRVTINGAPCTVSMLKELSLMIVSIQGQHEYQRLLKPDCQLRLIDQYANLDKQVQAVRELYQNIKALELKLHELNSKDAKQQLEFLSFQLNELDDLNLQAGELEKLESEHKQLTHMDDLIQFARSAKASLSENNSNISEQLTQALQDLQNAKEINSDFSNAAELLNAAMIQIDEANDELNHLLQGISDDPDRLNHLNSRLSLIQRLARKHQVKPRELLQTHQDTKQRLDELKNFDDAIQTLQADIEKAKDAYKAKAKTLSQKRKTAAKKLAKQITEKIQSLNMKGGELRFAFTEHKEPTPHGLESVCIEACTNPGSDFEPMHKIASGGELSRISLAVQVASSEKQTLPVLIFDEVDVGISGQTASVVGRLLHDLSQESQVLCITHLAQVAAFGEHHFKVAKSATKNKTQTELVLLNKEKRIEEIARITGGDKLTKSSLENAKELLRF